jgi:hypothetical protein
MSSCGEGEAAEGKIREAQQKVAEALGAKQDDKFIQQVVKDFINANRGQDFDAKEVMNRCQLTGKYEAVRKALRRLSRDKKEIREIHYGRFVRYSSLDGTTYAEQVDKEHLVSKLIEPPETLLKTPDLHNVSLSLSVTELRKLEAEDRPAGRWDNQWDKRIGRACDHITIKEILNPVHPESICAKWTTPAWADVRDKKGGISERLTTPRGIEVTFQTYGTGSFQIFVGASSNPMSIPEFFLTMKEVSALMQARCGYTLEDLKDFFVVRYEFSNDVVHGKNDCSGKFAITLREASGLFVRTYSKMMGKTYADEGEVLQEHVRTEVGNTKGIQWSEFLESNMVMMMGGVNAQYLIRGHFELERMVKGALEQTAKIGNAVEYLLAKEQRKSRKKKAGKEN